eukprot:771737-Alexandrium_andersonii.AAC.1
MLDLGGGGNTGRGRRNIPCNVSYDTAEPGAQAQSLHKAVLEVLSTDIRVMVLAQRATEGNNAPGQSQPLNG